ncbi:MAG: PIN domain-containing protein [Chloroflexi bacterium]|nr:PIN domain-containing protein [Chloroflexota bacterium]
MLNQTLYVTDTHSLLWYLSASPRLSAAAKQAFDKAQAGKAKVLVPVIVIAEMIFLIEKGRVETDVDKIINRITGNPHYEVVPLRLEQVLRLKTETAIRTMHDRMIVCDGLIHDAKLITRDEAITQAGVVEVIW